MNRSKQAWWPGQRGEGFVIVQLALFLLILLGPRTAASLPPWPTILLGISSVAGVLLLVLGTLVSLAAVWHLGSNLTPLPHPKEGATLVVTGMYRFVRHPIYLGVILMATGFALLVQGWMTLAEALVLAVFFDIKSRREETWLAKHFSDYMAYQRRVRKLIPFIY